MLRKHLLLASACCAGLALAATGAQAQKGDAGLIQPKGGWAVTKIEDQSIPGGAYCTLARQYTNGVIFSIGRNQAEEYSLAVDFVEPKLNPDKGYKVTLKAGTTQTRQLEIQPASPRAMVIRLGWDDSFFDAMEKSQTFSITLDQESYAFATTDYTKGKTDLTNCMGTLKAAPAAKGGTDVLNAESGTGSSGFAATKIAEGSVPKDAPPAPSKKPEKTIISSLDSKEVPGLSANDKAAFVPPTRSVDIATLEQENEKLRRTLDDQRRSYESQIAQGNQNNELAELREKLRIAESKGVTPSVGTAPVIAAPAPPVVKEVVKEVVKPDPAQAEKIAQLEQQVAQLSADKAAMKKADAARTEIKPMTTPLPNPEQAQRIAALQKEAEDLKAQLAQAKQAPRAPAQNPADAARLAELEKANADYAKRITELQTEVGRWHQASVEQSKAAIAPKQDDKELAALKASLQQKEQELAALKAAPVAKTSDNSAALNTEIESLKAALQQRNQEIADLQTKVASAAEQPKTPRPPSIATDDASAQALHKQISTLENELQKKNDMIRSAQGRTGAQDTEIASLKKQVGQLQRETYAAAAPDTRLQKENNSLKNQMMRQQDAYEQKIAAVQQQSDKSAPSGIPPILGGAGIAASADAARPANVVDAYQWKSGAISGRAQAMEGAGNAVDVSQAYANAQRNACTGDFASVPGASDDGRVTLDIACVDGNGGKAQSLLFAQQGGQVLAFILEAPAVDMDQAMDARDQISRTF